MDENCIFCKIIAKQIPSDIVYEDEEIIAFRDIHPVAPIHVLVIPKKHIESIEQMEEEDEKVVGRIYSVIKKIAKQEGIEKEGYRVIVNCGKDAGQEVPHLHFHLLGGRKLGAKIIG